MPREFRQDVDGYNVAIRHFEREYKRALANTTRSKEIYQGALDRIQWLIDHYRREQRDLVSKGLPRGTPPRQARASKKKAAAPSVRGALA